MPKLLRHLVTFSKSSQTSSYIWPKETSQYPSQYPSQYLFCLNTHPNTHWCQTGLKSGGAEWEFETYLVKFETYLVKFETYSVIRDYETKKTAGAPEPPEPPSLAPMLIIMSVHTWNSMVYMLGNYFDIMGDGFFMKWKSQAIFSFIG